MLLIYGLIRKQIICMCCTCGDGKCNFAVGAATLTRAIPSCTSRIMVIAYSIDYRRMWALDTLLYNNLRMLIHALKRSALKRMTSIVTGTMLCL